MQVDGRTTIYTLEPVKYFKQAKVNLFSLTSALPKGGFLSSDDKKYCYQSKWYDDYV